MDFSKILTREEEPRRSVILANLQAFKNDLIRKCIYQPDFINIAVSLHKQGVIDLSLPGSTPAEITRVVSADIDSERHMADEDDGRWVREVKGHCGRRRSSTHRENIQNYHGGNTFNFEY